VAPKIPLPNVEMTALGTPDTRALAPEMSEPTRRYFRESGHLAEVDVVTTELVRIRNARHQTCFL